MRVLRTASLCSAEQPSIFALSHKDFVDATHRLSGER